MVAAMQLCAYAHVCTCIASKDVWEKGHCRYKSGWKLQKKTLHYRSLSMSTYLGVLVCQPYEHNMHYCAACTKGIDSADAHSSRSCTLVNWYECLMNYWIRWLMIRWHCLSSHIHAMPSLTSQQGQQACPNIYTMQNHDFWQLHHRNICIM